MLRKRHFHFVLQQTILIDLGSLSDVARVREAWCKPHHVPMGPISRRADVEAEAESS